MLVEYFDDRAVVCCLTLQVFATCQANEEEYGFYMETTQHSFEAYAVVEDANQKLLTRQAGSYVTHFEEWETTYDKGWMLPL